MTTGSQQKIDMKSDEISLGELILKMQSLFQYLLSKWLIIFIFGLLGATFGFVYASYKKPIYIATTTFVLEEENSGGLGNLAGLASMAGVDLGGSGGGIFKGDNILELYKSRKMLQQTLLAEVVIKGKIQTLASRYIEFNELKETWAERPELLQLKFSLDSFQDGSSYLKPNRLRDSIITKIVEDIANNYLSVVKPDKKLSIIKVDVRAKDENFAKEFNDQIVKNVNDFYLQTKTKKSLQNVQLLQRKTDSVRSVMNGAIYAAVAAGDATPNLNPTKQVQRVAPAQKAQFSAETNKAILSSLVQNLEMSKVTLDKEMPLLEVVDQPIYPLTREKLGKAKGIIVGGLFTIIITIFFLIIRKFYKNIINE